MKTNRDRARSIVFDWGNTSTLATIDAIERALDEAVAEEREQCAKVAADETSELENCYEPEYVAALIRARGAK